MPKVWTKRLSSSEMLYTISYGTFIEGLSGPGVRISFSPLEIDVTRDGLHAGHLRGDISLWGPLKVSQRPDMTLEVEFL